MTPLGLAWRSLMRQPARAALGVAGVTIVGALLLDMLLLAQGLQVSFRDLLDSVGFDVRVVATDALLGTGPLLDDGVAVAEELAALPEVEQVTPVRLGSGALRAAGRGRRADLVGVGGGGARGTWTVLEGDDLPPHGDPAVASIVVNRRLAERLDVKPGDTARLRGTCLEDSDVLPPHEVRVVGIVDFRFDSATSNTAALDLGLLSRVCALDDGEAVDFLLVGSSAGALRAVEAIARGRPDLHVFSNRQLVERMGVSNFSYFRQISRALSTLTLFFAFLLVTTLLTVSVNQRLGEVAGLRALGFGRRRAVADLICESLLLVGVGGLLSLPVGGLLALGLDRILRDIPGLPERLHFFVFQPRAVLAHLSLLALTGILAAAYPVWLVARLPIAATLRKEVVS